MILAEEMAAEVDVQNVASGNASLTDLGEPRSAGRITVLVVTQSEEDRRSLSAIFGHCNWNVFKTGTIAETLNFLSHHVTPVILCDRDLPDGSWKQLLTAIGGCGYAPRLVVAARLADDRLWSEVLNLGGYDVLLKPFRPKEVFRVLSVAWHNWHDRHAVGAD
jgi:DNA-binding response OmpR family regulator